MSDDLDNVKARIPHREPFLFVDRVVEQSDGRMVTEREVRADEPHFKGHYPGAPLMPGVLICEACFQSGAMLLSGVDILSASESRASSPRRSEALNIHKRGRLPHWERKNGTYFVTWRLADSLPKEAREKIRHEREEIVREAERQSRELNDDEKLRLTRLHTERIEEWLNAGHGACHLNDARCAKIVADALSYFDGERYDLHAWCVMPNHVHVVFQVKGEHSLHEILHSWKSFTANECNKVLGRAGAFWMDESFDRLIRNDAEHEKYVAYTLNNPVVVGLENWEWVGLCGPEARTPNADRMSTPRTPDADRMSTPRPVLTRILEAKFRGMVVPGDVMRIEVEQEEKMGDAYVMNAKVSVAGKNVLRVKFIVAMLEIKE